MLRLLPSLLLFASLFCAGCAHDTAQLNLAGGVHRAEPQDTVTQMVNKEDPQYAERMGEWVAARCLKRLEAWPEQGMPDYVKHWLDHGGNSPANGDTNPTVRVAGWLMETTTDPTWDPILDPNWPHP